MASYYCILDLNFDCTGNTTVPPQWSNRPFLLWGLWSKVWIDWCYHCLLGVIRIRTTLQIDYVMIMIIGLRRGRRLVESYNTEAFSAKSDCVTHGECKFLWAKTANTYPFLCDDFWRNTLVCKLHSSQGIHDINPQPFCAPSNML